MVYQYIDMRKGRIVLLIFSLLCAISLNAQTREELEKKRKEIQQEIFSLQQAQAAVSKDKKASLSDLKLIEKKLRSRYAVINNLNDEMQLIDNTIFSNNREIYRLQKQLDTLRQQYAKTVEYAYKNRSSYDMLNFIFTSASFNDAIKRITYLKSYRKYRDEQVININKTQKELTQRIEMLSANKQAKGKVLEEQNKQKEILEEEKKEMNQFVSKLKSREKEIEKEYEINDIDLMNYINKKFTLKEMMSTIFYLAKEKNVLEELIEILQNSWEWGEFDVQLAEKILIDKGVDINSLQKKERINE